MRNSKNHGQRKSSTEMDEEVFAGKGPFLGLGPWHCHGANFYVTINYILT